jgi:hypothetical protein
MGAIVEWQCSVHQLDILMFLGCYGCYGLYSFDALIIPSVFENKYTQNG